MGDKFAEAAKNYTKNPIGIIGLFLVLIEAIAAIVVVQSSLNDTLNLILIIFIVTFPCVVLWIFYNLVTKHHEKLYSPSDYKDEKNFVRTYNSLTRRKELVERRTQESNFPLMPSKEGMSEEDIIFIKDTLNSIIAVQKSLSTHKDEISLVEEIKNNIDESWNAYVEKKRYEYEIEISPLKKSDKLISLLKTKGYNANIYKFDEDEADKDTDNECEAIWLGCKIPADMAIEVIKIAKSVFPHLKYIELSDSSYGVPEHIEYQLYIGGSTETARRNRLKELTQQDFEKFYAIKDTTELHNYVREFKVI